MQRGARAVALSRDHKPSLPDEMRRITDLGGKVIFWGRWRVEGAVCVRVRVSSSLRDDTTRMQRTD